MVYGIGRPGASSNSLDIEFRGIIGVPMEEYRIGFFGRLLCVFGRKTEKNVRLVCVDKHGRRFIMMVPVDTEVPNFPVIIEFSGTAHWISNTRDGVLMYLSGFQYKECEKGSNEP
jgi:hypothetical protein